MKTIFNLVNLQARLSRGAYWVHCISIWLLFAIATAYVLPTMGSIVTYFFNSITIAALSIVSIRRLHDRNYSGWWLVLILLPIAGAAWLLWQLALRRGICGDNRWGHDPLISRTDFLVVQ